MKTHFRLLSTEGLADFVPVEGTWRIEAGPKEDRDQHAAAEAIQKNLSAEHGFPIKVWMFRDNGSAIVDECPAAGTFLATRELERRGGPRQGAGRPATGRTVVSRSVSMAPEAWTKLDDLRGKKSRGQWIAEGIRRAR